MNLTSGIFLAYLSVSHLVASLVFMELTLAPLELKLCMVVCMTFFGRGIMAVHRAITVANYLIERAVQAQRPVSNMKLQKLLYYAQGWYMVANNGTPLFDEDFKRWSWGPVCPPVYNKFKKNGAQPIVCTHNGNVCGVVDNPEAISLLNMIWQKYGSFSAVQLSDMSHAEKPWMETPEFETITKDQIYGYFESIHRQRLARSL